MERHQGHLLHTSIEGLKLISLKTKKNLSYLGNAV